MKTLKVPKMLHDVLGEETTLLNILLIALLTFFIMAALLLRSSETFAEAGLFKGGIAFLLIADIIAGAIANFTKGTNDFYAQRPLNRWIFIAIHVQPLLLAWLLKSSLMEGFVIWITVIVSASITNLLSGRPYQRVVGAFFMGIGVFLVLALTQNDAIVLLTANLFFVIKVVFSFSVNHESTHVGLSGGQHEHHVL